MAIVPDLIFKLTGYRSAKSGYGMEPIKPIRIRASASRGDFTASATSQTFQAAESIPNNSILMGVSSNCRELLDAEGIGAAALDSGTAGNTDGYVDNRNVLEGSGSTGFVVQDPTGPGDGVAAASFPQQLGAAGGFTPQMTVTADVNLDTLTAGDVEVIYYYFCPEDPSA